MNANEVWARIRDGGSKFRPGELLLSALNTCGTDFVALECFANAPAFSKPDTMKWFVLWDPSDLDPNELGIVVDSVPNLDTDHPWIYALFLGGERVRFPWNPGDATRLSRTLHWTTFAHADRIARDTGWTGRIRLLPRFSTASRSCIVPVPRHLTDLPVLADLTHDDRPLPPLRQLAGSQPLPDDRTRPTGAFQKEVNAAEWNVFEATLNAAAGAAHVPRAREWLTDGRLQRSLPPREVTYNNAPYRVYGIKTGVAFVGSTEETTKLQIESNHQFEMNRSRLIRTMPQHDRTIGFQTEILTVTAPVRVDNRIQHDGFQVRDLSCMRPDLDYLPAQAIPYASANEHIRAAFQIPADAAGQSQHWQAAFGRPVGRAKAMMFLKYGLIHTSANAQNFLLGFDAARNLRHFILRDVGDTAWHDLYLGLIRRHADFGQAVFDTFTEEFGHSEAQTLAAPSDQDFQAPKIVRLAANSLLTHGFREALTEQCEWNREHAYALASAIIRGFCEYVSECLGVDHLDPFGTNAPAAVATNVDEVNTVGWDCRYPYDPLAPSRGVLAPYDAVLSKLDGDDDLSYDACLGVARTIHNEHANLLEDLIEHRPPGQGKDEEDAIQIVINALEVYVCMGIEKYLNKQQHPEQRFRNLTRRIGMLDSSTPAVLVIPGV